MEIGEKIRQLRKRKGISPEKLGLLSDVSGQYIRKLEMGTRKSITLAMADKLARGLEISISDLLDRDDLPPEIAPSPQAALRDLENSIGAYIPVYAEVSAGEGVEPIDYVACTRSRPAPDTMSAYRVKGLCLDPEIHDGDTLIVDTALAPQNGDLVIVIMDGQASVKRYREKRTDRWLENNSGTFRPEEVHLVGVVTEFNRKRR